MEKIRSFIKTVREIYSPVELILIFVAFFGISFSYFHTISENMVISIIVGGVGLAFFFYYFSYQTKKLNRYQEQLSNLLKYVTNIKFFLQTGENVLYSLSSTLPTLTDKYIKEDVETVITGLEENAELVTDHFEKYNFPSLDQFHQNLKICYEHGGDPEELFDAVQKNMMFELDKRDELYKKRKALAMNIYILLAIVAIMPLILRFIVASLWTIFLSYQIISLAILLITVGAILAVLYFTQKKKMDISVRI